MTSRKLDEELARISEIADPLIPNSVLLCNELYLATNEHYGECCLTCY